VPLVGGGGSPNVSGGGNPAGTGSALNYVRAAEGTWAYAYSGTLSTTTSEKTYLDFTTGNELIIGKLNLNGGADQANGATGGITVWTVEIDGQSAINSKVDTLQEDSPTYVVIPITIPPYTHIKITGTDNVAETDTVTSASITGRVY
jgi:hypothetical protein